MPMNRNGFPEISPGRFKDGRPSRKLFGLTNPFILVTQTADYDAREFGPHAWERTWYSLWPQSGMAKSKILVFLADILPDESGLVAAPPCCATPPIATRLHFVRHIPLCAGAFHLVLFLLRSWRL
jgi:hypothetical protein